MKLKNKLLTIVTPIVTIGAIAPVAFLSSCNSQQKEDKKVPTQKVKFDSVTKLSDINAKYAPFCAINMNKECPCPIIINMPDEAKATIYYQFGLLDSTTNEITWPTTWESVTKTTIIDTGFVYSNPIRFCAYNSTNPGQLSTSDTDAYQIAFNGGKITKDGDGIKVGGTARSLLAMENPTSISGEIECRGDLGEGNQYAFYHLFYGGSPMYDIPCITDINPGFLPFETMQPHCYESMFEGRTNLRTVPDLPSTKLAERCYYDMFGDCKSLTTAPYLPAHILANECYQYMFRACINLNSVSLGYVGNFLDDYFQGWLEKASQVSDPTLYYDGEDTVGDDMSSIVPKQYQIVSKKTTDPTWLNTHTKVIEVKNDSSISTTQTSKITGEKTKFRAYKDDLVANVKDQIPAHQSLISGVDTYSYYKKDGANDPEIIDLDEESLLVDKLPSTLFVKYEKPKEKEDTKATNIYAEEGPLTIKCVNRANNSTLQYYDNDTASWKSFVQGTSKTIKDGEVFKIRGNIKTTSTSNHTNIQLLGKGTKVELKGTIMSLLVDPEAEPATSLPNSYCFYNLFAGSTCNLVVPDSYMPPKMVDDKPLALTEGCFKQMFYNCTGLVKAPALPYETLQPLCYANMFEKCTSLSQLSGDLATYLPATKSAKGCYYKMFTETKLVTAPTINFGSDDKMTQSTSSSDNKYYGVCASMFEKCTSLTTADFTLQPTEVAPAAYDHMFTGCTSLTKAPKINAKIMNDSNSKNEWAGSCTCMFEDCKALQDGDVFTDTTGYGKAGTYSMRCMFLRCTSLNKVSTLRFTEIGSYTYGDMFKDSRINAKTGNQKVNYTTGTVPSGATIILDAKNSPPKNMPTSKGTNYTNMMFGANGYGTNTLTDPVKGYIYYLQ